MPKGKRYGKKHTRRQRGGASASYSFGSAVAPGAPYAQEVIAGSACDATSARPGLLGGYSPPGNGGLPGYAGGGSRKNKYKKFSKRVMNFLRKRFTKRSAKRSAKQRGGRWTTDLASPLGASGPNVFAPTVRLGCEGGTPYTPIPPPMAGGGQCGAMPQAGGATQASESAYYAAPLGRGPDSAFYQAPNAGYTNQPSSWVSSSGSPSLLQVPYQASSMNQACLKTGGGRKKARKATRKGKGKGKKRGLFWFFK
jgi:hypothetical protein